MPSGYCALHRFAALFVLAFTATCLCVAQAPLRSPAAAPLIVEGLGKGTAALDGLWQFHPGDDPAWASPSFDSSHWEQIRGDQSWGRQGHAHMTGFAWYRCSLTLLPAPGVAPEFALLAPEIRDSYEIYWNGALVGRDGKLPPRPVWYISDPPHSFALGRAQHGILAIRVWKAPLLSDDSGERGGFEAAPLIGTPDAIATAMAAYDFQWLRARQLHFAANLLCAAIAFLSLLLWLRSPGQWVLFWTAGFAIVQPATLLLMNAHIGWRYSMAMASLQFLDGVRDVSLWFLLLWLLSLRAKRGIYRLTCILAYIYIAGEVLDGVLVALSWNPRWTGTAQLFDTVLTILLLLFEAFPLILVCYALFQYKRFDSARWFVAILAFLDEMLIFFGDTVKQGRQFTGWAIADKIDSPLFFLDHNGISVGTLSGSLLLIAIVYAVYASVREDQRRQDALQREKMELQHESDRMRHHAEHDGLTGLWNHRVIVELLRTEMIRAQRDETPLCVILADIDHFKKMNDTFGHLSGDLVLKEVATVLARTLRPYDYVGRYGGEEFLMILPNCGMETALNRGEQLRAAVQSARIMDGETLLQVTASFGVASAFSPDCETETIIRAVDAALYRAKSCGRNCVIEAEMDASVSNR